MPGILETACKNCSFSAKYNEDLSLSKINGNLSSLNTGEYLHLQTEKLKEFASSNNSVLFFDKNVEGRLIYDKKRHKLGEVDIFGYKNGIEVHTKKEKTFYEFNSLYGVTILGKRKINFYLEGDKTLQIKGSKRFNGVKYLHLYRFVKEKI